MFGFKKQVFEFTGSKVKVEWYPTQRLAATPVRPQLVALDAPAPEASLGVGTALAAVALLRTLIHICRVRGQMSAPGALPPGSVQQEEKHPKQV